MRGGVGGYCLLLFGGPIWFLADVYSSVFLVISDAAPAVVVDSIPPGRAFTPGAPLGGCKVAYAVVGPRTPAGVVWFGVFME